MSRSLAGVWLILLPLICLIGTASSWAQFEEFCQLEEIRIEPLPNAVRIRIIADGLLRIGIPWEEMGGLFQPDTGSGDWTLKPTTRMSFRLENVRGGTASMVKVGYYPVSHLEFSVAKDSRESLGLVCTLSLFRPGVLFAFGSSTGFSWNAAEDDWLPPPDEESIRVTILPTRAQNELLITVSSDRPYEAPPKQPPVTPTTPCLEVRADGDILTLEARGADIHEVVDTLARAAGETVYLDDAVQRKVTARLESRTLGELLKALATAYGLSLTSTGATHYMSLGLPEGAAAYWASTTRVIPLRNIRAEDALYLLPDLLLMHVRPNTDGNSVTVTGPPSLSAKIERDLQALDTPAYHCQVRAWLVTAEAGDERVREVMARIGSGTTDAKGSSAGRLRLEVDGRKPWRILAELRALRRERRIRLGALPSLVVTNGRKATLFLGQQTYYWRVRGEWDRSFVISPVQAGTKLEARPWTAGEWITVHLETESGAVTEHTELGPLVTRQSTHGTIRCRSGETIIIGGLTISTNAGARGGPLERVLPLGEGLSGVHGERVTQDFWVLMAASSKTGPVAAAMDTDMLSSSVRGGP